MTKKHPEWNLALLFELWPGSKSHLRIAPNDTLLYYPKGAENPVRYYFTEADYLLAIRMLNRITNQKRGMLHYWVDDGAAHLAYTVSPEERTSGRRIQKRGKISHGSG